MQEKIYNCFISLMLTLCLAAVMPVQAQSQPQGRPGAQTAPRKEKKGAADTPSYPLYNGVSVGVDLWGLGSGLLGGDFISTEVAVDVNLKHRYFPVVEVGYGSTDTWSDKGTHYKGHAPYFRIGLDYNAFYKKKHGNMLLVGMRYAVSSFKYDINTMAVDDPIYGTSAGNPEISDGIWGGTVPFNYQGMKGSMQWLELCVGIRAHIWHNIYMGWSARYKFRLSASTDEHGDPWYVPGFGKYDSKKLGVSYHITYKF